MPQKPPMPDYVDLTTGLVIDQEGWRIIRAFKRKAEKLGFTKAACQPQGTTLTATGVAFKSHDLRGCSIMLTHPGEGEEQVIVTRIVNSTTCVIARPTWWRRAYWTVRRAVVGWWRE